MKAVCVPGEDSLLISRKYIIDLNTDTTQVCAEKVCAVLR